MEKSDEVVKSAIEKIDSARIAKQKENEELNVKNQIEEVKEKKVSRKRASKKDVAPVKVEEKVVEELDSLSKLVQADNKEILGHCQER